jgi:hypothetical protein
MIIVRLPTDCALPTRSHSRLPPKPAVVSNQHAVPGSHNHPVRNQKNLGQSQSHRRSLNQVQRARNSQKLIGCPTSQQSRKLLLMDENRLPLRLHHSHHLLPSKKGVCRSKRQRKKLPPVSNQTIEDDAE